MPPFVILALPRSRTAWLSHFLSYGPWVCGHEELRHCRSLDDVKSWLDMPFTGTCETAAAPYWRTLLKFRPDGRIVVVRRDVEAPVRSFLKLPGTQWDEAALRAQMKHLDHKLDQIVKRVPNVLEVQFDDLTDEATCARIFEFCLGLPHDSPRWHQLAPMNIQCNMVSILRYFRAHMPQLVKFSAQVKRLTLTDITTGHNVPQMDDVEIAEERFETFIRDAGPMIEQHEATVGKCPGTYKTMDLELHGQLDDMGALQVMTARSNGRVFGYLVTVIGPSLEHPGGKVAFPTSFFASADLPGVGRKLQLASKEALRDRGVQQLVLRAGVVGDGPRLRRLYERMGAQPNGELFLLNL